MNTKLLITGLIFLFLTFIVGCGPSLQGIVVMPDGKKIEGLDVMVWTKPWTDSVKTDAKGNFKISTDVNEKNNYTIYAQDKEGNMGLVKDYKLQKDKQVVVKLSKEMDAKDAVIEGSVYDGGNVGAGENIFKPSQ